MKHWFTCIDESLRKSNFSRQDIGYLAILHMKRSGHEEMIKTLGLTAQQTIYLEDYGHIGQVDQILSLHLALHAGNISQGTVVCMVAAGIGYVWAADIIQWGVAS